MPTIGEADAVAAMRARVTLWNSLVEIERDYLSRRDALAQRVAPELASSELARTTRRAAWQRVRDLAGPALDALDADRLARIKAAAHASGLYWCNSDDVIAAYRLARTRPGDLRFHSWYHERGKVSVRWQTGLPVAELFGDDTRCQVNPVPPGAYTNPLRSQRLRLARTALRIRVASDARHKPVWLELPFPMHRQLPEGGLVRQVAAYRERIGTKYRWSITITVELPASLAAPIPKGTGTVAIDLGWRKLPEGLRVAAWHDSRGDQGELVLPDAVLKPLTRPENVRSIRDQDFNLARQELTAWLKLHSCPDWLTEATRTLGQWKSPARLASLVLTWRSQRFPGDDDGHHMVETWRHRDKHLYEFEANERDQARHRRLHEYRQFAAWLANRYRAVVLEEFDLSEIAESDDLHQPARHYRVLAAPSTLRLAILNAARRERLTIEKREAAWTTQTCHRCSQVDRFDAAIELVHRCARCGAIWDQDQNAARNLLSQTELVLAQNEVCGDLLGMGRENARRDAKLQCLFHGPGE